MKSQPHRKCTVFVALACAAMLLSGCAGAVGGGGSSATETTNSTGSKATSALTANPTSVAFGSVSAGGNKTLAATLTNSGSSSVVVSGVSLTGAGISASGVSAGRTLAPGETATLNLTFAPSSTGSVSGTATVNSTAANSPTTISLSGSGVQAIQHTLTLSWIPSLSNVGGYNVYRGTTSGGYKKINSSLNTATTYRDTSVLSGQIYYYVVTSVAANSVESLYSSEASVTVPTP